MAEPYNVEPAMDPSGASEEQDPDPKSKGHSANRMNVNPSATNADCLNLFNVCCAGICFGLGECLIVFTGCFKGCAECCGECCGDCCRTC